LHGITGYCETDSSSGFGLSSSADPSSAERKSSTVPGRTDIENRQLSPIDDDGQLFVAANHWPRAWYRRALENPDVWVTRGDETSDYRAVPVSEQERERLLDESGFPKVAYLFTGFAPRQFIRLDPR
jgi:hypothetical protein